MATWPMASNGTSQACDIQQKGWREDLWLRMIFDNDSVKDLEQPDDIKDMGVSKK